MKIRIIHTQTVQGPILIPDIDEGVGREYLDEERKQPCYVTFYKKEIVENPAGGLRLVEDRSVAGSIDLVLSDKVRASFSKGSISGLLAKGLVAFELLFPDGPIVPITPPVITSVTGDGVLTEAGEEIVIEGTGFLSVDPLFETIITITDGNETVVLDSSMAGVSLTATQIVIDASVNTLAGLLTEVLVQVNDYSDSMTV